MPFIEAGDVFGAGVLVLLSPSLTELDASILPPPAMPEWVENCSHIIHISRGCLHSDVHLVYPVQPFDILG